ncbi:MAG: bifunctional demethylmenaquinone methyltransferase/2-methoxy-6-polyprenyl-1,4-benzoquinol methylase UbiE [Pseudomonadota bacterium]|nr:bifunctional demethylmenaquinone methyltransferase/2-methoxy-6-polyprenyl-1,4-benzoquinol methylase UbiE [Pseudomonadota bacterium]
MSDQDDSHSDQTHFGFEQVHRADKQHRVREVFDSVAPRYDLMNDLMSFGLHRLWKRFTVNLAAVRPGETVLDLAGGTGDLARQFAKRVGRDGHVILSDINQAMLSRGRERMIDHGVLGNMGFMVANAEKLPIRDAAADCITIAFGLRNVTEQNAALAEMYRCLKPGGRVLILEFSTPAIAALRPAYDWYSFNVLPRMGRLVADDADSYRYLAESIRMHPDQQTMKHMMEEAGFENCQYFNLSGGIVAIHRGYRI